MDNLLHQNRVTVNPTTATLKLDLDPPTLTAFPKPYSSLSKKKRAGRIYPASA